MIAISNKNDSYYQKAYKYSLDLTDTIIVAHDLILAEFLNFYSARGGHFRNIALEYINLIQQHPNILIKSISGEYFDKGLMLYGKRRDKTYSFTDCVSISIILEEEIKEVLTTDRHFEQEGFVRLLK